MTAGMTHALSLFGVLGPPDGRPGLAHILQIEMDAVDRDADRAAAGEFQVQAAVLPAQREEAERRVRVGAVDVADADGADLVDGEDAVHAGVDRLAAFAVGRSEEHTSELQSLMRLSYAVFCLKKKKHQN